MANKNKKNEKKHNEKIVKNAWIAFTVMLVAALIAEYFTNPHVVFGIEGKKFFYAWFGLIACAAIVFVSKFLGIFLKRKENYYKEESK